MTPTEFVIFTIERLKARLRTNDLLTGLLGLLALVLVWLLTVVVVDQAVVLSRPARLVLVVVLSAIAALSLVAVLSWPTIRRLNNLYVARMIENSDENRFRNSLTTFVEIATDPAAPGDVRRAVAEKAARDLTELDVDDLIRRKPLRWMALVLATAGSVLLAFGLLAPRGFSAGLARAVGADIEPPTATRIVNLHPPDGYRVVAGAAVTVELQLGGSLPDEAAIELQHAGGHSQRKPMRRTGDESWEFTVSDLLEDMNFVIHAGDARSLRHRLIVYPLPHVREVTCLLNWPSYLRREPQTVNSGNIEAPVGTRVAITVLTSHPPDLPQLKFGDGRRIQLRPLPDGSGAEGEFVVPQTGGSYTISFRDREMQLENRHPVEYRITPLEDRPPQVELTPGGPLDVAGDASAELCVRAADDCGLAGARIDIYGLSSADAVIVAAMAAGELPADLADRVLRGRPLRSVALLAEKIPPEPQPLPLSLERWIKLRAADFGLPAGSGLLVRARATEIAPANRSGGSRGRTTTAKLLLIRLQEPEGGEESSDDNEGDSGNGEGGEGAEDANSGESGTSGENQTDAGNAGNGGGEGAIAADAGGTGDSGGASAGSEEQVEAQGRLNERFTPDERQRLDKLAQALDKFAPAAGAGASQERQGNSEGVNGPPPTNSTGESGDTGDTGDSGESGTSNGNSTAVAGGGSNTTSGTDTQTPETGHNQNNDANSGKGSLEAIGPRIMRLANELERGGQIDPALLDELGWTQTELRQVVTQFSRRFEEYAGAGGSDSGSTTATAANGASSESPGQVVNGTGSTGTGSADYQRPQPGTAGTVVRPADRPPSPEYDEIIDAYLRAVNQTQ